MLTLEQIRLTPTKSEILALEVDIMELEFKLFLMKDGYFELRPGMLAKKIYSHEEIKEFQDYVNSVIQKSKIIFNYNQFN